MKIGWFSNWFSLNHERDSGVPKNIREIPVLKELFMYGQVVWVGSSSDPKVVKITGNTINAGGILKGVPRYDKNRWGSSGKYVRDIVLNYPKYKGSDLPEVDCVFVRVLPSFIYENLKIYLMLYRYGLRGTPVFARDLELLMIKRFITNGPSANKPFGISGSDTAFTYKDWNIMNKNLTILAPIPEKGIEFLEKRAPHLKFKTFYFPYDKKLYPALVPLNILSAHVTYIGNDTGRRYGFSKYFKNLPQDFVHVYGGAARQINKEEKGFPQAFKDRLTNVKWHEPVPHYRVNMIYNNSATCMNIPRPYFNNVGFISARFFEAAFSGAVLLLPEEFLGASYWTGYTDLVIKDSAHLRNVAETLFGNRTLRKEMLEVQRGILKTECDVKRNVHNVMQEIK